MPFTHELVDELNTLIRFDPNSTQTGLKVHANADPAIIAATQRLHAKGMLTLVDGGYLTPSGQEVAKHAQATLGLLTPRK